MNKMEFSTKRFNVVVVAISLLLMLVVLNFPFKANKFGDITFHEESKNLALFIKGEISFEKVVITKAPGPLLFYTPVYLLAPVSATDDQLWTYAVFFTFLISTISLLLIFRITTAFFSKEVGLLNVFLFFIFPIHCYYSLGILAEIPAFFSLAVAIFGWTIAFKEPEKKRGWILLTYGMWLFILNRPNAMLLLGIGFLVVLYSFYKNKPFFNNYGKKLMLTFVTVGLLGFGVLQLAKSISVNKVAGNQESLFYFVAHIGRFQFREEPTDLRFWESDNRPDSKDYQNWIKNGEKLDSIINSTNRSYNDVYQDFLIQDALSHPFWFTRQFFVKCMYGHVNIISKVQPSQFDLGPFKGAVGFWSFLLIINSINLIVLIGVGLFLLNEKNLIQYWIFWGITVALLIFHGLTYMEPRYIFPSKVALYSMSAAGLYRIYWIKIIINKIATYLFPISKSIAS